MPNIALTYVIDLGEVEVGEGPTSPTRVIGENVAGVPLRAVKISPDGDGAEFVQLAIDVDGTPGAWLDAIEVADRLEPSETFAFWSRVNPPDDAVNLDHGGQPYEPAYAVESKRFI